MSERQYLVALYSYINFGPQRIKLLVEYFESFEKIWNASSEDLLATGLSQKIVSGFRRHKNDFDFDKYFSELKKRSIKYIAYKDKSYPTNLVGLDYAPLVLYVRGNLRSSDSNAIAIVGTRRMTNYGREVAYSISSDLSKMGITIVSGLALGIDAIAHRACLDVGGRGIVVLASGLDQVTPLTNKWIADEILEKDGAIISEYPLGYPVYKGNFINRNRIISGLSKAVVVIEGLKKSGTLHTASHAANQGKTVFAVPGQITSPTSGAPHFLLKRGAKVAFSAGDIINELGREIKVREIKT